MDESLKICKNCMHWKKQDHWHILDSAKMGRCDLIKPDKNELAIVFDHDGDGALLTNEKFGCNQFEGKEGFKSEATHWNEFRKLFGGN